MSYETMKFQRIKNAIKLVDKYAEFVVNFNINKMKVYSRATNKEVELLHSLRMNNIIYTIFYSKEILTFYIDL
jgi:hypothetical protein